MLAFIKFYDFRSNISRSATSKEKIFLDISIGSEPEVNNDRLH
jgi:hypothetical protein